MLKRLQKENGTWVIKLWKSVSGAEKRENYSSKKSKYTCKSKLKKKKLKKERKRKEKNNEDIKWWF